MNDKTISAYKKIIEKMIREEKIDVTIRHQNMDQLTMADAFGNKCWIKRIDKYTSYPGIACIGESEFADEDDVFEKKIHQHLQCLTDEHLLSEEELIKFFEDHTKRCRRDYNSATKEHPELSMTNCINDYRIVIDQLIAEKKIDLEVELQAKDKIVLSNHKGDKCVIELVEQDIIPRDLISFMNKSLIREKTGDLVEKYNKVDTVCPLKKEDIVEIINHWKTN